LLAEELSHAVNAAAWSISTTTDDCSGVRTVLGVETALDSASGLRVVEPARDVVYPLGDYPTTAWAIEHGSAFVAGVDVPGSDPGDIKVLRDLGHRAVLTVGTFEGRHGYMLKVYADGDHAELIAIAPIARVLAHHCARVVTG
jgi:hypothetical protein